MGKKRERPPQGYHGAVRLKKLRLLPDFRRTSADAPARPPLSQSSVSGPISCGSGAHGHFACVTTLKQNRCAIVDFVTTLRQNRWSIVEICTTLRQNRCSIVEIVSESESASPVR